MSKLLCLLLTGLVTFPCANASNLKSNRADSACLAFRKHLHEKAWPLSWSSLHFLDSITVADSLAYPLDILDEFGFQLFAESKTYNDFIRQFWVLYLKRVNQYGSKTSKLLFLLSMVRNLRNNLFFEEALTIVNDALSWGQSQFESTDLDGLIYQKGMIYHDLGYFESAIKLFIPLTKTENQLKSAALEAYASCLRKSEQEDERDSIFTLLVNKYAPHREFLLYYNWGTCENNLLNSDLADNIFCRAENILNKGSVDEQAFLFNKLARSSFQRNDYPQALYYNSLALKILQPNVKFDVIWRVPKNLNTNLDHSHLIDLLSLRAMIYFGMYEKYHLSWIDQELIKLYSIIKKMAWLHLMDQNKFSSQLVWQDYLIKFFNATYFQYFFSKKDNKRLWEVSELSRGIATSIQRTQRVSRYPPVSLNTYRQFIFNDSILETVQTPFSRIPILPDGYSIFKIEVTSYDKIQKEVLSHRQTMLVYVWLPDNLGLYLFKLSKKDFQVINLSNEIPQILGLLDYYNKYNNSHDQTTFNALKHQELYDRLVKPAGLLKKQLIIVPMGPLNGLSFGTLIKNQVPAKFLIQDHDLSYQMSATLWHHHSLSKPTNLSLTLSFAPDYSHNFTPLAYNHQEVQLPAKLTDHQHMTFLGDSATPQHYLQYAGQASIIHFAAHAEIDEGSYLKAKIILDQNSEPNSLDFQTILRHPLQANLVVLSGCKTGGGDLRDGEGMVSLINAFTAAGAESVLSTFWPVYDQVSLTLMDNFYQGITKGDNLSQAISEAQRQYLVTAQADLLEPYYWGGFGIWGSSTKFD